MTTHVKLEGGIIPGLYWPMFVCILTENIRCVTNYGYQENVTIQILC